MVLIVTVKVHVIMEKGKVEQTSNKEYVFLIKSSVEADTMRKLCDLLRLTLEY